MTKIKDVDHSGKKAGVIYKTCMQLWSDLHRGNQEDQDQNQEDKRLETCLKEDQAATRRWETAKSVITEHAWEKL